MDLEKLSTELTDELMKRVCVPLVEKAWTESRAAALEEAAQVCIAHAEDYLRCEPSAFDREKAHALKDAAGRILALKEVKP